MRYYKEAEGKKEYYNGISIVADGFTIINPTNEQLLDAGYTAEDDKQAETLDVVKALKIAEINEYCMSAEVNEFTFKGAKGWIDADTRVKYSASIDAAITIGQENLTLPIAGKLVDVNAKEAKKMLAAVLLYADATFFVTQKHKQAVLHLTTKKDVKAYNYKAGYPQKLTFN